MTIGQTKFAESSGGFSDPLREYGKTSVVEALGAFSRALELKTHQFIVIGGANLVIRNLVARTPDIDLLVPEHVLGRMFFNGNNPYRTVPPAPARARGANNRGVAFTAESYGVPISGNNHLGDGFYPMSFETQAEKVEIVEGLPLQDLTETINSKSALRRSKDVAHLNDVQEVSAIHFPIPRPSPLLTTFDY